ncbi:serine/threonine-protein kinase [Nocardia sp. NPDC023988]|uniref:serine/threonine-protein kinase n=1 Tax=unclassified Nocardia TaxID=2637762 RepID=UPI0033F4887D
MSAKPLPNYPAGTVINDRYEFLYKLGSDGHVYAARDRHLDKTVALKLLDPIVGESARSWDEARRLEALKSRCLLEVLNADVDGPSDIRFIVTPLAKGGDVGALAKDVGLGLQQSVRIIRHIAAGIDRIHAAGMVHRDIKPGNALVSGDDVVVSDLGYCAILDSDGKAARNGSWCTVAPEVAAGGDCTVLSDVYSLGATAFYVLAGEYPVSLRYSEEGQRDRIMAGEIRNLRDLAPHVPQSAATVIRKALKLNPVDRHSTAEEFANALVGAVDGRRDWSRVLHPGHSFCLRGEPFKTRAGVVICSEPEGANVRLIARNEPSMRRLKGNTDLVIAHDYLSAKLRTLVASLSS